MSGAQPRHDLDEIPAEAPGPYAEGSVRGQPGRPQPVLRRVAGRAARKLDQLEIHARRGVPRIEDGVAVARVGGRRPGERQRGDDGPPRHGYRSCTIDATDGTPLVLRMKSM